MKRQWALRSILLAGLALLAAGCAEARQEHATPSPLPTQQTTAPAEMPTTEAALPQDATVLKRLEADLDSDGTPETITVYQQVDQLGAAIASPGGQESNLWRTTLGSGKLDDMSTKDANGDGFAELLLQVSGPEAHLFRLWLIHWARGQGQLYRPQGGPAADERGAFRSSYYPPFLDDTSGDNSYEIVVAAEGTHANLLDTVVYEWDGQAYARNDEYVAPPRVIPTPVSP